MEELQALSREAEEDAHAKADGDLSKINPTIDSMVFALLWHKHFIVVCPLIGLGETTLLLLPLKTAWLAADNKL